MKTRLTKPLLVLTALLMLLFCGLTASAADAEALPTKLPAPGEIILYDNGSNNTNLVAKLSTPNEILDIYQKGSTNKYYDEETYTYRSDYGEYFLYNTTIQYDRKIDDGEWAYTSDWDTDSSASGWYYYDYFSPDRVVTYNLGYASSYSHTGVIKALEEVSGLLETTDGSWSYYRMDTENHSVSVKARYFFEFYDASYNKTVVLSDWSEVAVYGKGNAVTNTAPSALSAPIIENLEIYNYSKDEGHPEARFDLIMGEDILDALMWSDQYNAEMTDSEIRLEMELSLDPNFSEGAAVYKKTFYESSVLDHTLTYNYLFSNLYYELPTTDGSDAFSWNGETVYVRARFINERKVSGQWSEIQSPYSTVVSITGPVIKSYEITIEHGSFGFDNEGYYSKSYSITENCKLGGISCSPLEGCYVDKVTINGVTMYAKDDESTYELLDWDSDYEYFNLLQDANTATEDLTISITYAGTATAQYGITTSCGDGGALYSYSNYVSWDDDSLVVYHGSSVKIYIEADYGFVIDTVVIDGEVNEEAKENGYYEFTSVADNSHSIEATFKREAYYVSYWAGANGTISTEYEWWNGRDGYVKIGDDITFTFAPNADNNGNYYEITNVYVDNIVNDTAKSAQSYTFENVQAGHSIDVRFSNSPVITHDITATSGENGSISPEGVVHVREGDTRRFEFIPDPGYEVDKVYVDSEEITNLASTEYYNISNVTEAHTIYVTFKKAAVQYNVTVLVSGHNTEAHSVSPKGVTPVWDGDSFTVSFSPFAGYEVEKVLVNDSPVTAEGSYTIPAVTADTTIEIFFKVKSYSVSFVDHDGTILKTETVAHGSQATAPADPTREHYVFTGWDTDFSGITTAVTIRATYKPAEYTVKFLSWDGSVLKTETIIYAESATAPEAPARDGYDFSHWSESFTNISSDLTVTAVYTRKVYTVTFVDSDDSVLSTQSINHGEAATAPPAPTKDGYTFIGWDNNRFDYVTQAMTIKAMYVEDTELTYTVTARALGESGTVTPYGVTTVQKNGSLVLSFTPDSMSEIEKVVVDGVEIGKCSTYTFENITENHTIDVYFVPTSHTNSPFSDVPVGSYYYNAILWVVENGITAGTSEATFSPDWICTRAQAMTFLWRAAGSPKVSGEMVFTDVASDAYYHDAVLWAIENGITAGTSATTFSPDQICSRAEICTFLWRTAGSPKVEGEMVFIDVAPDAYYYDVVLWAVANNITAGTSATTFGPDDGCTRAQIVTFLWKRDNP